MNLAISFLFAKFAYFNNLSKCYFVTLTNSGVIIYLPWSSFLNNSSYKVFLTT